MTRKFWEVGDFIGRTAQVKLVDFSSGSWGHINFDDLRGDITCSAPETLVLIFLLGLNHLNFVILCVSIVWPRRLLDNMNG